MFPDDIVALANEVLEAAKAEGVKIGRLEESQPVLSEFESLKLDG